jgi:hypothetical protein
MDKTITIFDRFKQDVLTFTTRLGGKDERVYLLDELLYDEHDLVDYQKLSWRLRKLPAVLTFYITMKKSAERALDDAKEEFEAWYASAARDANDTEVSRIMGQAGPASMKKPPTLDQIKGLVQVNQAEKWREMKDRVRAAQERHDLLSAMYEGLKAAVDLVRSETKLLETLLNQGLEQAGGNPASRFQPQRH